MENSIDVLIKSITLKKPISFIYVKGDKPKGKRIGNVHAVYIGGKNNHTTMVNIFQTEGVSESKKRSPLASWREFDIKHMKEVKILVEYDNFDVADGYKPSSKKYANVLAKV